jgi:hypothetical protein
MNLRIKDRAADKIRERDQLIMSSPTVKQIYDCVTNRIFFVDVRRNGMTELMK